MPPKQVSTAQTPPTSLNISEQDNGTASPTATSQSAVSPLTDQARLAQGQAAEHQKDVLEEAGAHPSAPVPKSLWHDLSSIGREITRGPDRRPLLMLAVGIFTVLLLNMVGQVGLNQWNGAFFDSLEARDLSRFMPLFGVFFALVAGLLVIVVLQTWFQELLKIRIRSALSRVLLDRWLLPARAYRLAFAGESGGSPDQRLQEDARLFSEFTTELAVGILQSTLLLITFVGVLWTLSPDLQLRLFDKDLRIPGYMVWIAIGYAGAGSVLTWLVGRPLIKLNTDRYAREADLRFALVRVNESAEGIALYGGEKDERRNLDHAVTDVLSATRKVSVALSKLTWITSGYGWVAMVVPIIAAAPAFFMGQLTFGELMMVIGAFAQVQTSLRYFVDNFPRIADWRSAVLRLAMFRDALQEVEDEAATDRIEIELHPENKLSFDNVAVSLMDGSTVVEQASAEISLGERVLITGESGSGKSTLFRAIAGLWPWGSGRIRAPRADQQMFMPQRPYLPLGTLRAAVSYPAPPDAYSQESIEAALERCGLSEFIPNLDREERWDRSLSLGQQQRIAFARVLLHRPKWIFMDESTSALDDESQTSMLNLFNNEMKDVTVLSIAHRPGIEAFHTRTIKLIKTPTGSKLFGRRPKEVPAPSFWRRLLAS